MEEQHIEKSDIPKSDRETAPVSLDTNTFKYSPPGYLVYTLWANGILLFLSICLYILSVFFGGIHHFDKSGAIDFVGTTAKVISAQKKPVTASDLDKLRSEMAKALSQKNYYTVNLERFMSSYDTNDTLFSVNLKPIEVKKLIGEINSLPDTGFRRLDYTIAFYQKKLDPLFAKYNLYQFITENDSWNNLEDITRYCSTFLFIIFLIIGSLVYYSAMRQRKHFDRLMRYQAAIKTSTDMTESWVTAQTMLDAYHQRNLDQNNWTFRLSVIVMTIGFAIIFYGIHTAIEMNVLVKSAKDANNGSSLIAIISTAAGVIVNLIGGTFLAIYNSTLKQAIDYTNSLQKTSTVGTSLAILKGIEDEQKNGPKDPLITAKLVDAKIAIAKQLIGVPVS